MIQNNPFSQAKARSIVYWYVLAIPLSLLLFTIAGIWFNSANLARDSEVNFEDPLFSVIVINLLVHFLIFLWLLYYQFKTKFKLKYLIGKMPSAKKYGRWLLLTIPLMLFSIGSVLIAFYLLFQISPETVIELLEEELFLTYKDTNYPVLYNSIEIINVVILAPLLEEFLFRGILIHRWSTKWSTFKAIIISSIVFGCLHLDLVGAFVFSLVLSIIYLRTKSLVIPITIHFLNNSIAVIISLLEQNTEANQTISEISSFWWQGTIFILLSLPWLIVFLRNNWQFVNFPLPYFANRKYM